MRSFFYLPVCLGLTLCARCHTDDPAPATPPTPLEQLPAETQTGAGTLGCLVNGQAFVAPTNFYTRGDWMATDLLSLSATKSGTRDIENFSLRLHGALRNNQSFSLLAQGLPGFPPAYGAGLNQFTVRYTVAPSAGPGCYYDGQLVRMGRVELVKFDGVARIAAGRFAFTLPPAPGSGCDTLRVTNGRFDIKF